MTLTLPRAIRRLTYTRTGLERSVCRESFFDFFQRFWSVIVPETLILNWHHEYLCNILQAKAEKIFKRKPHTGDLLINISPGTSKSTITTIMLPAWMWTRDPTIRVLCGSYSNKLSMDLATRAYDLMISEKYRTLFPYVHLRSEAKEEIATDRGGQRTASSTGTTVTGIHYHIQLVDDPLNPQEAVSAAELKAADHWFTQHLPSRKVDQSICPLIVIMQRLSQADPSGSMLERDPDVEHICLPAEVTNAINPPELVDNYVDGLFDPVRLPQRILDRLRKSMEGYGYEGQYLQSPVPAGGAMFRVDQIKIQHSPSKVEQVVRYWDKAGTRHGGAYTVGVKMARDTNKSFCVLDIVRGQWEAAERERMILQTAQIDGRNVAIGVEQEPGSGGKESAQSTARRLAGFHVMLDRPTGDKTTRADTYASQVNAGNVYLVRGNWNREYVAELEFFPLSRYKDQVDASSGAFGMLNKPHHVGVF